MGEVKQASVTIIANPGEQGLEKISVDPPGRPLKLRKVIIYFPAGTEGKLKIRILYGNMALIPESGYATGDNYTYEAGKEWLFDAGTPLAVEYINEDTSNNKVAYITITYEVIE